MTTEPGRWERRDVFALVAADTFDPLVERTKAMLGHDRRMVVIRRTPNPAGADHLDISVGARLDTGEAPYDLCDPFAVRRDADGNVFQVGLMPGILTIGFSAAPESTEATARHDWDVRGKKYFRPVTSVRIDGWPESPSRDDRIDIEHWNEHRVCTLTTIVFQADWG